MNYYTFTPPSGGKSIRIPESQYKYMLAITELETYGKVIRIKDVAGKMGLADSSVSIVLQNLRACGLIVMDAHAIKRTELGRQFMRKYMEADEPAEFAPDYLRCLETIRNIEQAHYNPRPKDIASEMHDSKPHISSIITVLEQKELVCVTQRGTVHLTEKGAELLSGRVNSVPESLTVSSTVDDTPVSDPEVADISEVHPEEIDNADSVTDASDTRPRDDSIYTLKDIKYAPGMLPVAYAFENTGTEYITASWAELFKALCAKLQSTDSCGFASLSKLLKNSICPIHEYMAGHFRYPECIADLYMLETYGTPDKLLRKLHSMVLLMNKDPSKIKIICRTEANNHASKVIDPQPEPFILSLTDDGKTALHDCLSSASSEKDDNSVPVSASSSGNQSDTIPTILPANSDNHTKPPTINETSHTESSYISKSEQTISHEYAKQKVCLTPAITKYLQALEQCLSEKEYVDAIDIDRKLGFPTKSTSVVLKQLKEAGFIASGIGGSIILTDTGKKALQNSSVTIDTSSDRKKEEEPSACVSMSLELQYLQIISQCLKSKGTVRSYDIANQTRSSNRDVLSELKKLRMAGLINVGYTNGDISLTDSGKALLLKKSSEASLEAAATSVAASTISVTSQSEITQVEQTSKGNAQSDTRSQTDCVLFQPTEEQMSDPVPIVVSDNSPILRSDEQLDETSYALPYATTRPIEEDEPGNEATGHFPSLADEDTSAYRSHVISDSKLRYLQAISQCLAEHGYVRAIDLSKKLCYSKPSISVALKKLCDEGLIHQDTNKFITLTADGETALQNALASALSKKYDNSASESVPSPKTQPNTSPAASASDSACRTDLPTGNESAAAENRSISTTVQNILPGTTDAQEGIITSDFANYLQIMEECSSEKQSADAADPDRMHDFSSQQTSVVPEHPKTAGLAAVGANDSIVPTDTGKEAAQNSTRSTPDKTSVSEPADKTASVPSDTAAGFELQYLQAISQCKREIGYVRAIDIAKKLGYSTASVSFAVKKLCDAGLAYSDINKFITLTKAGNSALQTGLLSDNSASSTGRQSISAEVSHPASSVSQDINPIGEISEIIDENHPNAGAEQDTLLSPVLSGVDIHDLQDSSESIGHTEEPDEESISNNNTSPCVEGSALFSANITHPVPTAAAEHGSTGHYPADMYTRISAYRGMGDYIFVSYSHKNQTQVEGLIADMQQHGYHVWFDEGIKPGTSWDDDIAEHIENCKCMIAMLSEEYMQSDNCLDELNFARSENKKLLLVYLSPVRLPGGMRMRLSRLQAIHRFKETKQNFIQKLFVDSGLAELKGLKDTL